MYASFTERDWKNVAPNNTFLDRDEWMFKKKKLFKFWKFFNISNLTKLKITFISLCIDLLSMEHLKINTSKTFVGLNT